MEVSLWIDDLHYDELCYPLSDVLEARTILINEFNVILLPWYNKKMYQQKMKYMCKNKRRQ
jgi:GTP-sensing pleiotropic transcriptional regulator CodY